MKQGHSGFTLLELIVGIAIAAILAAISIPSFVKSIRTNRGVTDANNLLAVLTLARSTAVTRDGLVTLCPTTSSTTPTCSAVSWDNGYLLFADVNNNGAYDSGTDVLLRTEVPFSKSSVINFLQSGTAISSITFNGTGQAVSSSMLVGYFDVKPSNTNTGERYVVLKQIGRASVCTPTDIKCGQ